MIQFQTIQNLPTDLNRLQSNVAAAFAAINNQSSVTPVTISQYSIKTSDSILVFNTQSISGVSSSNPLILILPDATSCNGFSFRWKKQDSSSNPVKFIATFKNKQNSVQTIEGSSSSYQVTGSLAFGGLFSDGNNWWVN